MCYKPLQFYQAWKIKVKAVSIIHSVLDTGWNITGEMRNKNLCHKESVVREIMSRGRCHGLYQSIEEKHFCRTELLKEEKDSALLFLQGTGVPGWKIGNQGKSIHLVWSDDCNQV